MPRVGVLMPGPARIRQLSLIRYTAPLHDLGSMTSRWLVKNFSDGRQAEDQA
jgi:hypothetical protein